MKIKAKIGLVMALLMSISPVFALSASDLNSVTNGSVGFNSATKTTTITTTTINNATTNVNWNRLNVGTGETLTNSFSGLNQTIINRVTGLELSKIAGTINTAGIGAATGNVVLVNPNGVIFNGATINVGSLLVSTLATTGMPTTNLIKLLKDPNISHNDVQIYNTKINTQNGASFVSNGNIDVRNSNISTINGHIQLVTADGVDFKFVNGQAKKVNDTEDYFAPIDNSVVTANNKTTTSKITISKSNLKSDHGDLLLNTNSEFAADSDVIVYGNSTVKAPDGTIYITAINTSYRNDPNYLAYLKNSLLPAPAQYSNAKIYSNIDSAKNVNISASNKVVAQNITATDNITLAGKAVKAGELKSNDTIMVLAMLGYGKGTYDLTKAPVAGNFVNLFGNCATITDKAPKDMLDVEQFNFVTDWTATTSTVGTTDTGADTSKYLPKVSTQNALAMRTSSPLAGAAAKVRRKQSPSKFIGHLESTNSSKIKYYEVLK